MTIYPSPIPRFHLAMDWNLRGHQVVTHLASAPSQSVHNPVDGHHVPVPHFGLILEFKAFADDSQVFAA